MLSRVSLFVPYDRTGSTLCVYVVFFPLKKKVIKASLGRTARRAAARPACPRRCARTRPGRSPCPFSGSIELRPRCALSRLGQGGDFLASSTGALPFRQSVFPPLRPVNTGGPLQKFKLHRAILKMHYAPAAAYRRWHVAEGEIHQRHLPATGR